MGFTDNLTTWGGLPVIDWTAGDPITRADAAYRLRIDWDDEDAWPDRFAQFLETPGSAEVAGLVIGAWGEDMTGGDGAEAIVEAVAGARDRLPRLTALFLADASYEECEISWIGLCDVAPLFHAYPNLTHFGVRGGAGLTFGALRHSKLRTLAVESGGLDGEVFAEIAAAELPALTHLEVYLGTEGYGGSVTVEQIADVLRHGHERWPALRTLGLRDYDHADELAAAIAADGGAPVLSILETLDLSLGTLGDDGVLALAACLAIARLKKLDIHHHYAKPDALAKLTALGIEVDAGEPQDESKYGRFVAVSE